MSNDWTRRPDSAFAVIVRGSSVLLVRPRHKHRWQLPGGGLHGSETARAAVLREVEEETGLRARLLGVTGRYVRDDGSRAVVFAACVDEGAEPAGPRNEIREQRWVPRAEAMLLLSRGTRRRLIEALATRGRAALPRAGETRRRESLRMSG